MSNGNLKFDEVGIWSEIKLEILKKYAKAYSTILSKNRHLTHVYIDGFAGAGIHLKKATLEFIEGSPLNALHVEPKFEEYYLIDMNGDKIQNLRKLIGPRNDLHMFNGDCNKILLRDVFRKVKYEDFKRGLCILDPYGLHLNWEVIQAAGELGTIDLFLNFPIMDINRNILRTNRQNIEERCIGRMNSFWGDSSWRDEAYTEELDLFEPQMIKLDNKSVVKLFRKRLKEKAKFKYVPEPIPMKNSTGATIYYLFFASQKPVAENIIKDIFSKYR